MPNAKYCQLQAKYYAYNADNYTFFERMEWMNELQRTYKSPVIKTLDGNIVPLVFMKLDDLYTEQQQCKTGIATETDFPDQMFWVNRLESIERELKRRKAKKERA